MDSVLCVYLLPPGTLKWLAVGLPLYGLVMWLGVLALIAHVGGWNALATIYPAGRTAVSGLRFGWRSARFFKLGGYNNCLSVTLCDDGVHVVPMWLFSFRHAPLLFPWATVKSVVERGWGWKQCEVEIMLPERTITLFLPTSATETVQRLSASAK